MKLKVSNALSKIVYALLAFLFVWVLVKMYFISYYEYSAPLLILGTLAALALMLLFWHIVKKREAFFEKHCRLITAGFLLFMLALQLAFSFPLRYAPVYDIGALFYGASEWTETGSFPSYYEYFAMFHNNFGGLVLFRLWFGMMKLIGITDFYFAACLLNSLLSIAAMYLTASSAGRLFGVRGRMTALFLFFISPPFYFIAPAFYTDALTMVFPPLIFRLWLYALDRKELLQKLACFVFMGLALALGYSIKATVLIMLIAVVIEGMLYDSWKAWLPLAAIAAALTVCVSLAVNSVVYFHVGRDEAQKRQVPITHWIMMGLEGWGGYNGKDYAFTKSFDDPAERKLAISRMISQRLRNMSLSDASELFDCKLDLVWNDGTYGLSDCLGCPHEQDNYLHGFLVREDGAPRKIYKHICTAVLAAMYLLLLFSCVSDIFTSGQSVRLLAPRLALLGVFIFFLIWEARWRYFSSYVPIVMLCAAAGLESASARLSGFASRRKKRSLS
ncbi:MAG: hypothetical protein IKI64_01190 [Clostridia bacterium]|nr:hypothetical protein [Clostridia bacterium]